MATTESRKQANARWDRNNSKNYGFKCFYKTDSDIMEKLDSVDNKNSYIKGLIRADIKKNTNNT